MPKSIGPALIGGAIVTAIATAFDPIFGILVFFGSWMLVSLDIVRYSESLELRIEKLEKKLNEVTDPDA